MTAITPELDVLEALDFDHAPTCDAKKCTPEPATHRYAAHPLCGHDIFRLYCTGHAERVAAEMDEVVCLMCDVCRFHVIGRLRDYAHLEPLS